MTSEENTGSFWDHLEVLRGVIIRVLAVWMVISIVTFFFKSEIFDILLAPKSDEFLLYRLIAELCLRFGLEPPGSFDLELINIGLARQFMIHMQTALCVGFVLAAPYALYEVFGFVSPGLYRKERHYVSRILFCGYLMFLIGIALSYLIIFPMTVQFLGSYQVAADVTNMISLDSYMGTLFMMCLCMGTVCELPVLSWLLAKAGVLKHSVMAKYRRHAIVIILIVAAVITPTSDIFTLLIVSVPIWILYEASILIAKTVEKKETP